MNDIRVPVVKLYAQNPHVKKALKPDNQMVATNPEQQKNLPQLVVPGFNDHHVILFGSKKPVKFAGAKYEPVDAVEKNSMDVFKNVAPSVVKINVAMEKVFVDPESGEEHVEKGGGSGSGSILDKEGHVLTNFHVINDADSIKIELNKGKEVEAKLIGADPSTDLALLKIDLPKAELEQLPIMKLGDSASVEGGQRAFAIGNPFNLYRTVTSGMVSALERSIVSPGGRLTKGVIQTDAPINPGNSGGALVNARGEQIGINAQIYSPSGASAGLGFAIPVNTAKDVVADLKVHGMVKRPFLGLSGGVPVEMFPPQIKAMLGIQDLEKGVIIQGVTPGGPAAQAGLKAGKMGVQFHPQMPPIILGGDIITAVDGKPVSNMTEIFDILDEKGIGSDIKIDYISLKVIPDPPAIKGFPSEPKSVTITVAETPGPDNNKSLNNPNMLKPLESDQLDEFGLRS